MRELDVLLGRFTGVVRVVLRDGAEWAEQFHHAVISPVHVVLAMLERPQSQVARAVRLSDGSRAMLVAAAADAYRPVAPGKRYRPLDDTMMATLREVAGAANAEETLGTGRLFVRLLDDPTVASLLARAGVSVGHARVALGEGLNQPDERVAGEVAFTAAASASTDEVPPLEFRRRTC